MLNCQTGLHDINEEVYQNLCELRSASEILHEFGYASVKEICFQCLGKIDIQNSSLCCSQCQRGCHQECLQSLASQNYEIRKRLTTTAYMCLSCIDFNRCMECKNYLDLLDTKVYSCSICLRRIHQRCHCIPSKVIQSGNQSKYISLNQHQIVCKFCISRFSAKEVIDTLIYNKKKYLRVEVSHPSPIHTTWVQDNPTSSDIKNENEESQSSVLMSSQPEIEVVLSMHVPSLYSHYTIDKISELFNQDGFLKTSTQDTFKFLTKWRRAYNCYVWQQISIFQKCKIHITKFLHQLKMNEIASHLELSSNIVGRYLSKCINGYIIDQQIKINTKIIGKNLIANQGRSMHESAIDMASIYANYSRKQKQYLSFSNLALKADAVCQLINIIYFSEKNPFPIALFTDQAKISWWITNLIQKSPYLTVLTLQGSQRHIQETAQRYVCKSQLKFVLYKFNVLIVTYQSLKVVGNLFDFKKTLQNFSLLVMDEKMSPLARYYYTNVKIARIKFHKQSKDEVSMSMNDKNQPNTSSYNSSQKRSSLTLSGSNNLKLFLEKSTQEVHKGHVKSLINSLSQQFCQQFDSKPQILLGRLLDELERLVFLKYILAFGLNTFNKEEIYERILKIEPECFKQPKESILPKLQEYLSYFIVHIYSLTILKTTQKGAEQIKGYFYFTIQPTYIFKIITDLSRIKSFCDLFENDSNMQLSIMLPRIALEDIVILRGWSTRYDYYICKGVLYFGMCNWETISQYIGNWKQNGALVSLRQFLCEAFGLGPIGLSFFSEFLRIRIMEIVSSLEKMFA